MQLSITGKNLEVTNALREYVEKKIGRLDRYLPNISDARVELSVESTRAAKDSQVAQVTVHTKRALLRAQEASADMFASIDTVFEKMQRQVDRYKGKRWAKRGAEEEALAPAPVEEEVPASEESSRITRIKRFQMVPMDEEEAIDQMELLGHDFFVFFNINQNQINVVYRRSTGDYGLIVPEMA
jgi:putative sigma-54 modulation protein